MTAPARRPIGRIAGIAGFTLTLLCLHAPLGALGGAFAREDASPKRHRSHPARTGQSAPDRTGSIGKAGPPTEATTPVAAAPSASAALPSLPDDGPLVPILLPNVPRVRMVACGQTWQSMKMNGTTGDDSWRDFALKCLVAKEAPPP